MNHGVWRTIIRLARTAIGFGLLIATAMPITTAWAANWGDSFSITFTPTEDRAPLPVTDLSAANGVAEGSVLVAWTAPSLSTSAVLTASSYEVRAATFSIASLLNDTTAWWNTATVSNSFPESVMPGTTESYLINGLAVSATWYFAITSKAPGGKVSPIDVNASIPGNQASVFTRDAQPIAPTGLTVVASTSAIVVLKWDDMKNSQGYFDFNYYQIWRSLTSAPLSSYASAGTSSNNIFIDQSVTPGVTYYYYLTGVDSPPRILVSSPSAVVTYCVPTPKQRQSSTRPFPPSGMRIEVRNYQPLILWNIPQYNTDRTPCYDVATCTIYRTTGLNGAWTSVGSVQNNGNTSCQWSDTSIDLRDSAIYYYKVKCYNGYGNASDDSMFCDTSANLNVIAQSQDRQINVVVPQSQAGGLYRGGARKEDVSIVIDENMSSADNGVIIEFDISAITAGTRERVNGFMFDKAAAQVVWNYSQSPLFQEPNKLHSPSNNKVSLDIGKELSVFWNNGVDWMKLSKVMNSNSLFVPVNHLGAFEIKESLEATSFTLTKVYPQIFTPNGDNRNDYVVFQYENPNGSDVYGKVYNTRGAYVSALTKSSDNSSLIWDGTKDGGRIAEPGVYVYQIQVTGQDAKVINGVVILAK